MLFTKSEYPLLPSSDASSSLSEKRASSTLGGFLHRTCRDARRGGGPALAALVPKSITPPDVGPRPENINRAIDEEKPEFAFNPAIEYKN